MLLDAVKDRIEGVVPLLRERVRPAADLAELIAKKALPQAPVTAFLLPAGLRARTEGDAAANAFTQMLDELVSVLVVIRTQNDITGAKALPRIDEITDQVIAALCGWAPEEDNVFGVFRLLRGQLLSAEAGVVAYQIDLAVQKQLRIIA